MAMIRQANAATMARDAVVLDLGDLKRQGEAIRARAQAEADQILAEAHAERERLISTASEEGHAEGLARGIPEGRAQGHEEGLRSAVAEHNARLEKLDSVWTAMLTALENERGRILLEARLDVLKLAAMMGQMVAKRVIAQNPEAVVDQVAAALSLLAKPSRVSLHVHPDDLPLLHQALPKLARTFASAEHVELVPDPSLTRGDCLLRTPSGGEIDASISTQLDRIVESLLPDQPPPAPEPTS